MWGKPKDASIEVTKDWYVVPLDIDGPVGVVGTFDSQSAAWDWIEGKVRNEAAFDGGMVYQLTKPPSEMSQECA